MNAPSNQETRAGWLVVLPGFFGVRAGFGARFVFPCSGFLTPIGEECGGGRGAFSRGFGFAAIAVAIASPKLGDLLDRFGARRIIVPCYAIYGLAIIRRAPKR